MFADVTPVSSFLKIAGSFPGSMQLPSDVLVKELQTGVNLNIWICTCFAAPWEDPNCQHIMNFHIFISKIRNSTFLENLFSLGGIWLPDRYCQSGKPLLFFCKLQSKKGMRSVFLAEHKQLTAVRLMLKQYWDVDLKWLGIFVLSFH